MIGTSFTILDWDPTSTSLVSDIGSMVAALSVMHIGRHIVFVLMLPFSVDHTCQAGHFKQNCYMGQEKWGRGIIGGGSSPLMAGKLGERRGRRTPHSIDAIWASRGRLNTSTCV